MLLRTADLWGKDLAGEKFMRLSFLFYSDSPVRLARLLGSRLVRCYELWPPGSGTYSHALHPTLHS